MIDLLSAKERTFTSAVSVIGISGININPNQCDYIEVSALGTGPLNWYLVSANYDGIAPMSGYYGSYEYDDPTWSEKNPGYILYYATYPLTNLSEIDPINSFVSIEAHDNTLSITAIPSFENQYASFGIMATRGRLIGSVSSDYVSGIDWMISGIPQAPTGENIIGDEYYGDYLSQNRIIMIIGTSAHSDVETYFPLATSIPYITDSLRLPELSGLSAIITNEDTVTFTVSSARTDTEWLVLDNNGFNDNYSKKTNNLPLSVVSTDLIYLTCVNDKDPFYITTTLYDLSVHDGGIAIFHSDITNNDYNIHPCNIVKISPKYIEYDITDYKENSVTLSAYFINDDGDKRSIIPGEFPYMTWYTNTTAGITSPSFIYIADGLYKNIPNSDSITIEGDETIRYTISASMEDSLSAYRTPSEKYIQLNDTIDLKINFQFNMATAIAIYENMDIPVEDINSHRSFNWESTLNDSINGITPLSGSVLIEASLQSLSSSSIIILSAIDLSDVIELSSMFTPTYEFDGSSELTAIVENIYGINNKVTYFDLRIYGITDILGTPTIHNIDSMYYNLTVSHNGNNYELNTNNYELGVVNENWDPLTAFEPIEHIVELSANNGVIGSITLSSYPYISEDNYIPILQIDNNNPTLTELWILKSDSINCKVDSTTKLEPQSTSGYYSFSLYSPDGIGDQTGGSNYFNDKTELLNSQTFFDTTSMSAATAVLSVTANFNGIDIIKEYITPIKFDYTNEISPDEMIMIPQYKWENSEWKKIINIPSYTIIDTIPEFIWGNGRSENFVLSTNRTDLPSYKWNIYSTEWKYGSIVMTNAIHQKIKTPSSSDYISAQLIGYTLNNVQLPPQTIKYPVSAIPIPDVYVTVNIENEIPAPGTLEIELEKHLIGDILDIPLIIQLQSINTTISCNYWSFSSNNISFGTSDLQQVEYNINLSDNVEAVLHIPKFEPTNLYIENLPTYKYMYVVHPEGYNDWDIPSIWDIQIGDNIVSHTTGYPVIPYYYYNNKYLSLQKSGSSIEINNISTISNLITSFDWESGLAVSSINTNIFRNFNGIYGEDSTYPITLKSYVTDNNSYTTTDNNSLVFQDEYPSYDSEITRQVNIPINDLPYPCGIGSNDWLTKDTINLSFKKILDNLDYLYKQSKIYDDPPTEYIGWLGSIEYIDNTKRFRWFVNIPELDYSYDNPSIAINDRFTSLQDCIVKDNILYISNTTELQILSSDFRGTQIHLQTLKGVNDPFNCIKTIQLDKDAKRLYLLDSIDKYSDGVTSKNDIIVFTYNELTSTWDSIPIYSWGAGTIGNENSPVNFRNPQDMCLSDDILWVADTDNLVIKKFYRNGDPRGIIKCPLFNENIKPISLCTDSNSNIQVLCSNDSVIVLDNQGTYLYTYKLTLGADYIKIRASDDIGFVYCMSNSQILKCNNNGSMQLPLRNYALNQNYVNTIQNRSIFQDEYKNLYVCQGNHILKYNDQIKYISLINDGSIESKWAANEIYIKKQEYVQDWVINRALNRLWDNIEIFRRSIIGKLSYKRVVRNDQLNDNWKTVVPTDREVCLIDWYPIFNHNISLSTQFCYIIPTIRTFLPHEYLEPIYKKDDVIIGINELVTADVLNRVLCQLHANLLVIKEMLSQPDDKETELCDNLTEDYEITLDSNMVSLSECYPELYEIVPCNYAVSISGSIRPYINEVADYELKILATTQCLNNIQKYNWYVNNNLISSLDTNETFNYMFTDLSTSNISVELSASDLLYTPQTLTVMPRNKG